MHWYKLAHCARSSIECHNSHIWFFYCRQGPFYSWHGLVLNHNIYFQAACRWLAYTLPYVRINAHMRDITYCQKLQITVSYCWAIYNHIEWKSVGRWQGRHNLLSIPWPVRNHHQLSLLLVFCYRIWRVPQTASHLRLKQAWDWCFCSIVASSCPTHPDLSSVWRLRQSSVTRSQVGDLCDP